MTIPEQVGDIHFAPAERELLHVVERLLGAIHDGDAEAYRTMCAPELTAFETDVAPFRIDGVSFHTDLIAQGRESESYADLVRCDMVNPMVHVLGDAGVVAYTRLSTYVGPRWVAFNETRVFARRDGQWQMVHFHRSEAIWPPAAA